MTPFTPRPEFPQLHCVKRSTTIGPSQVAPAPLQRQHLQTQIQPPQPNTQKEQN